MNSVVNKEWKLCPSHKLILAGRQSVVFQYWPVTQSDSIRVVTFGETDQYLTFDKARKLWKRYVSDGYHAAKTPYIKG